MPYNGAGTFTRLYSWVAEAISGIPISSPHMDAEFNGVASALSNCITRDGQSVPSSDIPWGGKRLTGLGTAIAAGDAISMGTADARYSPIGAVGADILFTDTWPAVGALAMVRQTAGYSVAGKGGAKYVRDGSTTWSTAATAKRSQALADFAANPTGFTATFGGVYGAYSVANAAAAIDASLTATEGRWRKADASGQYWTLSRDQEVNDTMFGALHNPTYTAASAWNARWTGNDDQPAIQAMIDWATYFSGRSTVFVAPGPFLIGKSLQIGYGDNPVHLELKGAGRGFAPGFGNQPFLVRNFCGQPGINVQGGLNVRILGIGSDGVHRDYFNTNNFAKPGSLCPVNDWDLTTWFDPTVQTAIGKSVDARYGPDCFVCVDGYSGPAQTGSYTPVAYPAWLGAASLTQFNKIFSTDTRVDEFACRGEINVMVVQPNGSDGNGDFNRLGNGSMNYCKRALSISQTQARSNEIAYIAAGQIGEFVANNVHGVQNGTVQGQMKVSVSGIIRVASVSGQGGSLVFMPGSKFEAAYQLADNNAGNVTFDHCSGDFVLQGDRAGTANRPIPFLTVSGDLLGETTIKGGNYTNFAGLFIAAGKLRITEGALIDGKLLGQVVGGALGQPYSVANNATLGGIIALGGAVGNWDVTFAQRSISAGTGSGTAPYSDGTAAVDRDACLPIHLTYAKQPLEVGGGSYTQMADSLVYTGGIGRYRYSQQFSHDKSVAAVTGVPGATKYEMTWTAPYNPTDYELFGGAAGDIVIDYAAQVAFIIRSYDGPLGGSTKATIATGTNGLKYSGGNWQPINAITTGSGALYLYNTRRYLPAMPMFVTTTTASGNLTAVGTRKGDVMGTAIAIGDYVDIDPFTNNLIPTAGNSYAARMSAFVSASLTATVGATPTRAATEQIKRLVRTATNS